MIDQEIYLSTSSENLDLEEMMEGIQESTASPTESTKSGFRLPNNAHEKN